MLYRLTLLPVELFQIEGVQGHDRIIPVGPTIDPVSVLFAMAQLAASRTGATICSLFVLYSATQILRVRLFC